MPIRNRFAEMQDEIAAWRRDFHAHPELQFEVERTAGVIAERLRAFGCDEVVTGLGRTGVVGIIHGASRGSGRTVGLRADMDALPIAEATGRDYASTIPGRMHACGHDGHSAMLLGAARYLAETRAFDGTVAVIFQPAEEGGGGGREMVADGLMERFGIDEVYGMHNWPGLPVGRFAIRSGPFFAATDFFDIEITGRGGHAARPQGTVDPTVIGAHLVLALQSIVSRNVDPAAQAVVSVTSFETSSTAYNVIPRSVRLKGTVRTVDPDIHDLVEARVKALAEGTAVAFCGRATVTYARNYPVMVNDETATDYAREAAIRVGGQCGEADIFMGGEDFAFMLNERPGAYILVGNGDSAELHHPEYDFNDDALPHGSSWFVDIAESRLPQR